MCTLLMPPGGNPIAAKYIISHHVIQSMAEINPLKKKRRRLYLKTPNPYRAVNTFNLDYKNQLVYAVSGTSRCLFWYKYKTHRC